MGEQPKLTGPDLTKGTELDQLPDGKMLLGHAHGEPVLLARRGDEVFAVGATCTHYSGPLAEGILVGDTVRCPWHHACFDLRSGAPSAPAFNPIPCYRVVRRDNHVSVGEKIEPSPPQERQGGRVVIVGAGASGAMTAEGLRRFGYRGEVVLLGTEPTPPIDRPNLSKDYLAGNAPEEWMELRGRDYYKEQNIDFRSATPVRAIDTTKKTVTLESGESLSWEHLVLATGADPVKLPWARVQYVRTLADSRGIIEAAKSAKRAVVIGASFIGLEVAASLRARGLDVAVVGMEEQPLAGLLGHELSAFVRKLHEKKGVVFHMQRKVKSINDGEVILDNDEALAADIVVAGVGVKPRVELAEKAGLKVDNGIVVDAALRAAPNVYAVGDVARWPYAGELVRIEHWVVAQRHGEHVARVLTQQATTFTEVPFFWSAHYNLSIRYVGHATKWDRLSVEGNLQKRDATVRYFAGDKLLAVATIGRDREALEAERALRA